MKSQVALTVQHLLLIGGLSLGTAAAQAAVVVHGSATSTGPLITVDLLADISDTPLRGFGVRVRYDPADVRVLQASNNTAVWFFHDGTRPLAYPAPDLSTPGQVLLFGAKLDARSPASSVSGSNVLLGTVVFQRVSARTPSFQLTRGHNAPFADFVTQDGATLDALSGEVVMGSVRPDPADTDLDGLRDAWEREYFGDIANAYYSDDPDKDGFTDLQEQALGSDPTRSDSNFQLTMVRLPSQLVLQWTSFKGRSYRIETSSDLGVFRPYSTGISATPPLNSFSVAQPAQPGAVFFRIVLE